MVGTTVLVVGLGDLGVRVLGTLARLPEIERLVGAGRNAAQGTAHVAQTALIAELTDGPREVLYSQLDVLDRAATAALLRRLDPAIIVMAASRHTWWRSPAGDPARADELAALPYGAWLPLHLGLVRTLMEARREARICGRVICLPLPDVVGPALAPLGLAPDVGAGNVTQVAAKLMVLAARATSAGNATGAADAASTARANIGNATGTAHVDRETVKVRLVMHHAVERVAFSLFASLGGASAVGVDEPPWLAEITVQGHPLAAAEVDTLFHAAYPLPSGTATHDLTAAATAHLVAGLLAEQPRATHAPAPGGRPGGYPILVSRHAIRLDLPPGIDEAQARAVNARAARWDGIEAIESDGTIVFTPAVAAATERILGLRLDRVAPHDQAVLADELLRRAAHR